MKIVLLLICIIFIMIVRNIKLQILNPYLIILTTWLFMIVLYEINIFSNFPSISYYTYFFIFTSLIILLLGIKIGEKVKISQKKNTYDMKKISQSNLFIFLLVAFSFTITIFKLGTPPSLGGTVDRSLYYIPGLETLYLSIYLIWLLSFYQIKRKYRIRLNITLLLLSLIPVFLKGNKFQIFIFVLIFIFFMTIENKIKLKYIIFLFFIIVMVFNVASYMYLIDNNKILNIKAIQVGYDEKYNYILLDPILYMTNNLMNLNNYLISSNFNNDKAYGLSILSGLLHFFRIDTLFANNYSILSMDWKNSLQFTWLTTGTYLKTLFQDFGYFGGIVINLFIGIPIGVQWGKIKELGLENNLVNIYLYLCIYLFLFFSFFTFLFIIK